MKFLKEINKYEIIKIMFKRMNMNSGIFLDWKLNSKVRFLKNWTLMIGFFLKEINK